MNVLVAGQVQGVLFREYTRRRAAELGVKGWVRNRLDGRVEAVFEGTPRAVASAVDFVREGPPLAIVSDVEVREEPPKGDCSSFEVR